MVRLGWVTCTVWATTCPVSDTWLVLRTDTRDRSPESRICGSGILELVLTRLTVDKVKPSLT